MSDEVIGKGRRIPEYVRPPIASNYDSAEFSEESARSLAYINGLANSATTDHDDIKMLFRCGMQFMRYLAKKYNFTIKQWPEK